MEQPITYVGLDVHKDTIAVALAEAGKRREVREYGKIANTSAALKTLAAKLSRGDRSLRFCYEAGPCGYGIQRQLSAAGHGCVVVAPSLIPRKPGDRIKTDRRDAVNLAKLHRAGELTAVWVPDQAHEAIRDLVRARLAAVRTLRQARQQLSGFLLRHGHHYHRPAWTLLHRRWLAGLKFEQAVHHIVLEDCIAAVEAATARRDRLEAHIEAALPEWSLAPVVRALQALRGMALVAAATLVAELGDITPLRQSTPAHGVSGPGSVRAFQRRHAAPGRHHQGGQRCGATNADRSGLELSVSGPDQPRTAAATGEPGQADPRHRVEGSGTAVSAVSQARPGRKTADRGHRRDRARAGRASFGRSPNRRSRSALDALKLEHDIQGGQSHATTHPILGKAGGTVTARRTLVSTISRISSDAGLLDRGSSATHHRSGGNQPAHQSMINRRFMIVPPALPRGGHAEQLERRARNFRACSLKRRT